MCAPSQSIVSVRPSCVNVHSCACTCPLKLGLHSIVHAPVRSAAASVLIERTATSIVKSGSLILVDLRSPGRQLFRLMPGGLKIGLPPPVFGLCSSRHVKKRCSY